MNPAASGGAGDPLEALQQMTDRLLAPLVPMFVAMNGNWPIQIPPQRVLRSLVLMAFFDLADEKLLCREIRARSSFRRFLQMAQEDEGPGAIEPARLLLGLDRLSRNQNAREFLRDIVAAARDSGLMSDETFSPSEALILRWTPEPASLAAGR